jgi:hypothetical protein
MNINKKAILSLFLIIASFCTYLKAFPEDEWDINEAFLDDFGLEIANMEHIPTRALASDDIIGVLTQIKAHSLLKKPFYFYTQPLRRREIVDEVSLNFPRYHLNRNLIVIPFYNQMSQAQFRRDRTGIKNYIDMQQTDLVNTINEFAEDADNFDDGTEEDLTLTNIDIPDLLNLFTNIKVQERRLGVMFQYTKDLESGLHLSLHAPLLYQEYNYSLTNEEISAIENSDFFKNLPQGDYWDFATKHLLSDKLGIGDIRISLEQTIKETDAYRLNVGIDLSVPSNFAIKKGVVGAHFDKKKKTPTFNINDDFIELNKLHTQTPGDTSSKDQLLKNAEALALGFLDRLGSVLLEHPLGNYRHAGFGPFTRSTMIFSPTVELTSKLRVNLLIPAKERRFIKTKIDPQELDNLHNKYLDADGATDPEVGDDASRTADINRYEAIFLTKFFPESYDVTVMPGLEISSSSQLTYERPKWTISIGGEMWYHTKESFLKVHTDSTTLSKLEIKTAKKEYAYQSKTWVGIDKKKKENSNWQYGIRGSVSGINDGIGDDFTLTFHCIREF